MATRHFSPQCANTYYALVQLQEIARNAYGVTILNKGSVHPSFSYEIYNLAKYMHRSRKMKDLNYTHFHQKGASFHAAQALNWYRPAFFCRQRLRLQRLFIYLHTYSYITWFENPTFNSLAGVWCQIETAHNQKLQITKAQIINLK